jgi:general secretion pathway protein M
MRSLRSWRALFALGSTLLVLVLGVGSALGYLLSKADRYDEILAGVEPRYARLVGLRERRGEIGEGVERAEQVLAELAYPASLEPGRAGADLQQKLFAAAEGAGFSVTNSRIGTVESQDAFDEISLSLSLRGPLASIESLLADLPGLTPVVRVKSLSVTHASRRKLVETDLRVQLVVTAARLSS